QDPLALFAVGRLDDCGAVAANRHPTIRVERRRVLLRGRRVRGLLEGARRGMGQMSGLAIKGPESQTILDVRGFRLCALRERDLRTDVLADLLEQESGRHAGAGR